MILVSGGTGTIGARLVRALVKRGHGVRALTLPDDPFRDRLDGEGVVVVLGDVTRPETLSPALAGVHTVYHLAAVVLSEDESIFHRVNVEGTRHLVNAAGHAGVTHFVHVSSASVVYPRSTPYSRSKREAERIVEQASAESGMPYTIVRPTLVYEEGGGAEFALFVDHLRRLPVIPLPGCGRARKNPVYVDDLIWGLAELAQNPVTFGQTYDLCGGEEVSLRELARLTLAAQGLTRLTLPVPVALWRLAGAFAGKLFGKRQLARHTIAGLTQDAALDPGAAAHDLGYRPVGIHQGIRRCFPTVREPRLSKRRPDEASDAESKQATP